MLNLYFIVKALCKKHRAAVAGVESMQEPYRELTASLDQNKVTEWTQQALKAEHDRGEALDIYALRMDKG